MCCDFDARCFERLAKAILSLIILGGFVGTCAIYYYSVDHPSPVIIGVLLGLGVLSTTLVCKLDESKNLPGSQLLSQRDNVYPPPQLIYSTALATGGLTGIQENGSPNGSP